MRTTPQSFCVTGLPRCRICTTMWDGGRRRSPGWIIFLWNCVKAEKVHKANKTSDKNPNVCCSRYAEEDGPKHWPDARYEHVMKLRQVALESAREMWADYFMVGQQRYSLQAWTKAQWHWKPFSFKQWAGASTKTMFILFNNSSRSISTESRTSTIVI